MIPIKLELKNFLSYGNLQTINFDNHNLICLSGKNGHGKSALLDAITWAVWGQARKIAGTVKPDAQLLRLGQTAMTVCFDFLFNGSTYRIRREFSKNYGKLCTTVDFGVLQDDGKVISLTDKTSKLTQQKIEKTIGLTYESFINSAFLRQGQSNEFSKKSPKERKEILASILGLNTYEQVRKAALDKIRSMQTQFHLLQEYQGKTALELQQKNEIVAQNAAIAQKSIQLEEQLAIVEKNLASLNQDKNALSQQALIQQHAIAKQKQLCEEKNTQEVFIRTTRNAWIQCAKEQSQLPPFKTLEASYHKAKSAVALHQQKLEKSLELKNDLLALKQQEQNIYQQLRSAYQTILNTHQLQIQHAETEKNTILSECKLLVRSIKENSDQLKELALTQQSLQEKGASSIQLQKEYDQAEKQFEKRKNFYHIWQARAQHFKKELHDLQQKQALTMDQLNPSCPLCEQNLSVSRKKFLKTKFEQRIEVLHHCLERFTKVLPALKQILIDQNTYLTTCKQTLNEYALQQSKNIEIEQACLKITHNLKEFDAQQQALLINLQTVQKKIEEQSEQLKQLLSNEENTLAHNEQVIAIKKSLAILEAELAAQEYDPVTHQTMRLQCQQLEEQISRSMHMQEEQANQEERKRSIYAALKALRCIKKELNELEVVTAQNKDLEEKLTKVQQAEAVLLEQIKNIRQQKELLFIEKGKTQQYLTSLEKKEEEQKAQQKELNLLVQAIKDYQLISAALSKDGIQALLIEEAIPEIEHETNLILSQLTNNQAHIIIESLKDLQKGGTKETLDIKISDASGIRPYELFSGGEAFRIDFALRIAISKLLARRAGTCLQTLIIDEGFGSQDEEGLNHIMDAIHAIQDSFAKIIIVSHLPIMKDQFPVHFLIEKGAQGSSIKVIEQG